MDGRGAALVLAAGLAVAASAGCGGAPESGGQLPDGGFDYQLGGAYPPAGGTRAVVRDAADAPAPGVFSVCYVNGFQTQPGEAEGWLRDGLVLRGSGGDPVADPEWPDEYLLDTSEADLRTRIAERIASRVGACADAGFDAVEFDNLDSFTRSGGALGADGNFALAADLTAAAHRHGLLAAQKNTAEETGRAREAGFDFAVAESCAAQGECAVYTAAYGRMGVLDVEYPGELDAAGLDFAGVCADPETPPRTVLRDLALEPAGAEGHLREHCPDPTG